MLSVVVFGCAMVAPPAATEPPVGNVCAHAGAANISARAVEATRRERKLDTLRPSDRKTDTARPSGATATLAIPYPG